MRLIDADRLLTNRMKSVYYHLPNGDIAIPIIDIEHAPTVDTVPLEPLCDWLAERYEPPYALIDIDKLRIPIDFRQQKEIWMAALTKWMEEQDAAD